MIQKWSHYLLARHFLIKIDHQSLKYLIEQQVGTNMHQQWLAKLMDFDYKIVYQKGKENVAVDALSRQFEDGAVLLAAISIPISNLHEEIEKEILTNKEA